MRTLRGLASAAIAAAAIGCANAPPLPPPIPPRPAPTMRRYDYSHRMLKEMDEQQRMEFLQQQRREAEAAEAARRAATSSALDVSTAPSYEGDAGWAWASDEPEYFVVHGRHYPRYHRYTRRGLRYGYDPFDPLPIGNTLLFGTLGGVIGHQSGHRDEGILIGAGYGLLRDLAFWAAW